MYDLIKIVHRAQAQYQVKQEGRPSPVKKAASSEKATADPTKDGCQFDYLLNRLRKSTRTKVLFLESLAERSQRLLA